MTVNKQYLFLFSIGPVQSFIAQARKTQDLYAGSKILSELAKSGLIAAQPKEIIFPSKIENPSLPNRFLCIIETPDARDFGKNIVEKAVRAKWNEIAKYVLGFAEIKGIKEQIDAHLDINWAFQEIKSDFSDYTAQYEKIERLLGAVKNARSFSQFNYQSGLGEKGRKCSLDGERNVKFYRLNENENETEVLIKKLYATKVEVSIIENSEENKFTYSKIQSGEGLSAVSMVKRCYTNKTSFDSTADIAMKNTISNINMNENDQLILETFKIIGDKMNAQLYYEENHTEAYYKKHGISLSCLNVLKENQSKLKDIVKDKGLQLTKYYAVIDFDGDEMGKWLSGSKINDPERNLKDFHQKLSGKLAEFAADAKKIVDKYGQTVYAGGDDFLGFLSLNDLFEVLQDLRNKFKENVNDELQKLDYLESKISFSAGVCISHYKEPLGMVLAKASAAQKTAKNDDKGMRDSFCIVASKHSGENHETYFKWGINCNNVANLESVIHELIKLKGFSNTFIKSLNIEFARLTNCYGELIVNREILNEEVTRLLKRSFMGSKDDKKLECDLFLTKIMSIYDAANNFDNFMSALNICDFMHRLLDSNEEKVTNKPILQNT